MGFRTAAETYFVQSLFRRFYENRYVDVYVPSEIARREFGYMPFGHKVMVRHLSFKSFDELRRMLAKEVPLHVYRSAALYQYPQAPMEEKGWEGAELVFDIDADHLGTPCLKTHDYILCLGCGNVLESKQTACSSCGSAEILDVKMVCDTCLQAAKTEMAKLIGFMEDDFGISPSSFILNYSGNRGYHLAVTAEEVMGLDRYARQEIVDYVSGSHIDMRFLGLPVTKHGETGPGYTDKGWAGRAAREAYAVLNRLAAGDEFLSPKALQRMGDSGLRGLSGVARYWSDIPRWDLLKTGKRSPQLETVFELAVENAGVHIDTVVTTDVHRILRLADSLNGKTGLKACRIDVNSFEDFDPLNDAVALDQEPEVTVRIVRCPEFRLAGDKYGPYRDEKVRLPAYAAAYLLCRGLAKLVKD
jgi:DNA primase small subunit